MSPEQIVALIAALAAEPDPNAFASLKAGGANPDYPVTVTPCARPVAPTEIDGQTVICGTVEVPFDHRAPEGARINIAFNLYKAHSLSPQPDAVFSVADWIVEGLCCCTPGGARLVAGGGPLAPGAAAGCC